MAKSGPKLIYGIHPVKEAVMAGIPVEKVLLRKGFRLGQVPGLIQQLRQQNVPVQFVPVEKFSRLTGGNHQGIIALLSETEYTELDRLVPRLFEEGRLPALAMLDGITDVRNFGAIARSAECAGLDGLIVPAKGTAQINAEAIRTSSGALHSLPVCRVGNLNDAAGYMHECGIQIISASEKASDVIWEVDLRQPVAIVMGSEDTGVSAGLLKISDRIVRIPVAGKIQSLNVSAAASVIFYEIVRQRGRER